MTPWLAMGVAAASPALVEVAEPLAGMPGVEVLPDGQVIADPTFLAELGVDFTIVDEGGPLPAVGPWLTPDALDAAIDDLAADHEALDDEEVGTSLEGRPIRALRTVCEGCPRILVLGGTHAREVMSPVAALQVAERLAGPDGAEVRAEHEVWVVPLANPDGYAWVFEVDRYWRKNRRDGTGVDLNRNFPEGWYGDCGGETEPTGNKYRGVVPASEVETRWIMAMGPFARVIDLHSYGRTVLHGFPCLEHPYEGPMAAEVEDLSHAVGFDGKAGPPSAEGEHFQWQIAAHGSLAYLLEMEDEFHPDAPRDIDAGWLATEWIAERPAAVSGRLADRHTDAPVLATVTAGELEVGVDGRLDLFLPPGTYTVTVDAAGYRREAREVDVGDEPVIWDVLLSRGCSTTGPGAGWLGMLWFVLRRRRRSRTLEYQVDPGA